MALFLILILYFVYYQIVKSPSVISSAYNPRQDLYAKHVVRGDILSADGKTIAETRTDSEGNETRVYPYDNLFAHAVGYSVKGKAGIESQYNFNLLQSHSFVLRQVLNSLQNRKNQGDSVVTTLNYDIQKAASDALGSNKGAVVVLNPKNGKVLAMVSKPDFDPNTVSANWESLSSDEENSRLLNRASLGLYPPGSIFKVVTTLEYMHENDNWRDFSYNCTGSVTKGNTTIHCYNGEQHGTENLKAAFENSCNSAYATIGLTLNLHDFRSLAEKMLFNRTLPTNLKSTTKSRFTLSSDAGYGTVMQTSIGQGDTLVSPLHMAMIASAVANNGTLMEPYMVSRIQNDSGTTIQKFGKEEYGQLMSETDAKRMKKFMRAVVKRGTATALNGQSYEAAGKTGSAEYNSARDSHGWFIGYAKKGKKKVAIAVIVENGGSGSRSAVPVAKQVFDSCFD